MAEACCAASARTVVGLIAEDWEIEEATGKAARGPLPPESNELEYIVGTLDSERASDEEFGRGEPSCSAIGERSSLEKCWSRVICSKV